MTTKAGTMMLRLGYLVEEFEYNSLIVVKIFELGDSLINDTAHSKESLKF